MYGFHVMCLLWFFERCPDFMETKSGSRQWKKLENLLLKQIAGLSFFPEIKFCDKVFWRKASLFRSSSSEVLLEKGVLNIWSKFIGERPCRIAISIKLLCKLICNFIETAFRYGCSPVNLLHIFRTHFPKNTSGRAVSAYSCLLLCIFLRPKLNDDIRDILAGTGNM